MINRFLSYIKSNAGDTDFMWFMASVGILIGAAGLAWYLAIIGFIVFADISYSYFRNIRPQIK